MTHIQHVSSQAEIPGGANYVLVMYGEFSGVCE